MWLFVGKHVLRKQTVPQEVPTNSYLFFTISVPIKRDAVFADNALESSSRDARSLARASLRRHSLNRLESALRSVSSDALESVSGDVRASSSAETLESVSRNATFPIEHWNSHLERYWNWPPQRHGNCPLERSSGHFRWQEGRLVTNIQ